MCSFIPCVCRTLLKINIGKLREKERNRLTRFKLPCDIFKGIFEITLLPFQL